MNYNNKAAKRNYKLDQPFLLIKYTFANKHHAFDANVFWFTWVRENYFGGISVIFRTVLTKNQQQITYNE